VRYPSFHTKHIRSQFEKVGL